MKEFLHYDDMEDRLTIQTVQDVEPILEANKKAFNDASSTHKSEVFNKVASIPFVVLQKVYNETGVDLLKDEKALREFLNDPDNRFLRTRPGRI